MHFLPALPLQPLQYCAIAVLCQTDGDTIRSLNLSRPNAFSLLGRHVEKLQVSCHWCLLMQSSCRQVLQHHDVVTTTQGSVQANKHDSMTYVDTVQRPELGVGSHHQRSQVHAESQNGLTDQLDSHVLHATDAATPRKGFATHAVMPTEEFAKTGFYARQADGMKGSLLWHAAAKPRTRC